MSNANKDITEVRFCVGVIEEAWVSTADVDLREGIERGCPFGSSM